MFTGLIEEIGTIQTVTSSKESLRIKVIANKVLQDIKLGDSISTNGVCLTVTEYDNKSFCVDVMPETYKMTNLKYLTLGDKVNLERALRVGDRVGGHFVSGHIDGVGKIESFIGDVNAIWITICTSSKLLMYIIKKGSIAIDGISLTVAYVDEKVFKVSIIPHTKDMTTLVQKKVGDEVNLECDMIGKYVERFLRQKEEVQSQNTIDLDFLSKHGFA